MASELKNDQTFAPLLDAAFRRWEAALARGLQRIQDRGGLVAEADPTRLATAVIAALQGGMLLARVRGDVAPLQDTLVNAVLQLHQWERKATMRNRRARRPVNQHPRPVEVL